MQNDWRLVFDCRAGRAANSPGLGGGTIILKRIRFRGGRRGRAAGRSSPVHRTRVLGAPLGAVAQDALSRVRLERAALLPLPRRVIRQWTIHLRQVRCEATQARAARVHQRVAFPLQGAQRHRRRRAGRAVSLVSPVDVHLRLVRLRVRLRQAAVFGGQALNLQPEGPSGVSGARARTAAGHSPEGSLPPWGSCSGPPATRAPLLCTWTRAAPTCSRPRSPRVSLCMMRSAASSRTNRRNSWSRPPGWACGPWTQFLRSENQLMLRCAGAKRRNYLHSRAWRRPADPIWSNSRTSLPNSTSSCSILSRTAVVDPFWWSAQREK